MLVVSGKGGEKMTYTLRHAATGEPIGYFWSREGAESIAASQRAYGVHCYITPTDDVLREETERSSHLPLALRIARREIEES
jgi:hypothetical protein